MATFHERIKELRDESGKTQLQIAEDLDLKPQNLSYYFNGREPNYDILIKIADYFKVSVDYLIGRTEYKTPEFERFIEGNIQPTLFDYIEDHDNNDVEKHAITIMEKFYNLLILSLNLNLLEKLDNLFDNLICYKQAVEDSEKDSTMSIFLATIEAIKTKAKDGYNNVPLVSIDTIDRIRYDQKHINDCVNSLYSWINTFACTHVKDFERE